jgi:dienelactone hydrolase
MKREIILFFILVILIPFGCLAQPEGERVKLKTEDGFTIIGTYYVPAGEKLPSLILLHMLGRTRSDWEQFAKRLKKEGYAVLSIDLRGHGESTDQKGKDRSYRDFSEEEWRDTVKDIQAATKFLRRKKEIDPDKISIIGASIGANLALNYADLDKKIRALVLLSPGLNYRGVKTKEAVKRYGARPVLLVASKDDRGSFNAIDELGKLAKGNKKLVKYKKAGHGTRMFGKESPDLTNAIINWLKEVVK